MRCSNKNNEIPLRKRYVEDNLFLAELFYELSLLFLNSHAAKKTERMFIW